MVTKYDGRTHQIQYAVNWVSRCSCHFTGLAGASPLPLLRSKNASERQFQEHLFRALPVHHPLRRVGAIMGGLKPYPTTRHGWYLYYAARYDRYGKEDSLTLATWYYLLFIAYGERDGSVKPSPLETPNEFELQAR